MRGRIIYTPCQRCQNEDLNTCHSIKQHTLYKMLKNQTGIMCFKCERGHNNCVIVQELPFEKLINYSIDNVSDQYYRGAVFNFATALESFFEFTIELLAREHGLTEEEYSGLQKLLRYSERQFGAFCTIYYYRFKERPFSWNTIEDKAIIRNKVIHQGQVPTIDEVYKYGNFTLEHIYKLMNKLINDTDPKILFNLISTKYSYKLDQIPSENTNVIKIDNSFITFETTYSKNKDSIQKIKEYSCRFPEEYEKIKQKADLENKILDINSEDKLIFIEKQDGFAEDIKAEYKGPKTVDEVVQESIQMKKLRKLQDLGLEEGIRVVSLTEEDLY